MAHGNFASPTFRQATFRPILPTSGNASHASSRTMSPESIMLEDSDDEAKVISSARKTKARSSMNERALRRQPLPSHDAYPTHRGTKPAKSQAVGAVSIDSDDDENLEEEITPEAFATVQNISIPPDHEQLDFAATRFDQIIRRGMSVALDDGAFMRIAVVVRDRAVPHKILIGGNLLRRNRDVDKRVTPDGQELHGWMPRRKNELCAIVRMNKGGEVPKLGESLAFRPLDQIGLVRNVLLTNTPWIKKESEAQKFECRCEKHFNGFISAEDSSCPKCAENREANGPLRCRFKYVEEVDLRRNKITGWQFRHLDREECDSGHGVNPVTKLATFRGRDKQTQESKPSNQSSSFAQRPPKRTRQAESDIDPIENVQKRAKRLGVGLIDLTLEDSGVKTPASTESLRSAVERITVTDPETGMVEHFVFPIDEDEHGLSRPRSKEKCNATVPLLPTRYRSEKAFTFVDICAGAGGTARGAEMAGLKLQHLVDNMPEACQTQRLNFGNDVVLEIDMTDFIQSDQTYRADVMHISFPCQGHSKLNRGTNAGRDLENIALSYGTFEELLKKCKPRVVTMEQVEGIYTNDGGQHLRSQIHALLANDYNLRWASLVLSEYGNPQGRHRLIVIASCPGQVLPDWPERTHGPGLQPFVTIQDMLEQVQRPDYNQEVMEHAVKRKPGERDPYAPNVQVKGCITGSGGYRSDKPNNNYHPSGTRDFTYQEKAQLQGFPFYHRFYGGKQKVGLQIGNAVPPVFAEKLFRGCIKALEDTDKLVEEYSTPIDID